MAFYEGWGKKIQQTGQGAIDKTKKGAEIARLNSSVNSLEKEVAKKYEELGNAYYHKFAASGAYDPDMSVYFQEISAQMDQLEEYRKQICVLKGFRKCPECGQEVDSAAAFCNYCGAKLEPITEDPSANGRTCPNCGSPLEEDQVFCTVCGTRLDSVPSAGGETVTEADSKE